MRFGSIHCLSLSFLFVGAGCGMGHLATGQTYVQRGNLPVAVEYFDAGLVKSPNDEELRDAMIVAEQTYHWQLRDEIDRLKDAGAYLLALSKLTELIERGHRLKSIRLPGEELSSLDQERTQATREARKHLANDLDKRAGRSQVLPSDLRACRQLQTLGQADAMVDRRCAQLQKRLQISASIQVLAGAHPNTNAVSQLIEQKVLAKNPELIQFVAATSDQRNAVMKIYLESPQQNDTGWYLTKRDAYHTWVEKLDRKGRPIKRTITIPPSAQAIANAKKQKKEPPKAKQVSKQVYIQVKGEYRYYAKVRSISIPYRLTIEDLRKNETVIAFEGTVRQESKSQYHEYQGHPRATNGNSHPGGRGKHTAVQLQSPSDLAGKVIDKISSQVAASILKRVE